MHAWVHSQLSSTNESIRQRGKNKAEEKNSGLLHAFSLSSITKAALGGPLVTHSNRGGFILARFFTRKQTQGINARFHFAANVKIPRFILHFGSNEAPSQECLTASCKTALVLSPHLGATNTLRLR